jgi:D-alanyl-D-alanine carboxypeptidase/D-alanyl-D-alanine-endopeptidase (penicillin-binding protein 4)
MIKYLIQKSMNIIFMGVPSVSKKINNYKQVKLQYFTFLVFVVCGIQLFGQNKTETKMTQILAMPEYTNAAVGVYFQNLENGESVFELNSEKLMIPASVLKIVTTASALELLGDKYRFKTQIGYSGKISNHVLNGDLILLSGGDPTLGSQYLKSSDLNNNFLDFWVQKIKAAGIRKIDGNLILDGSVYDSEKIPPTWIWEDIGNYYGAGANAFTVYDNLFELTFKTSKKVGELSEIISVSPKIDGLKIINEVVSSEINKDLAFVFGSPLDKERLVRGTLPKARNAFKVKAAIHEPGELLARDFLNHLAKEGIFLLCEIKFQETNKSEFNPICTSYSPELSEIIKTINHKSINLFAEHLVRQIAFEKTGIGNRNKGIEIIREFWYSKGLGNALFFMEDGSGLSTFNAISPSQISFVLDYMYNHSNHKQVFINSLPNAGIGTLSSFSKQNFPEGSLRTKSGSMTRIRCYTGYLKTDSNKNLAFTIMFNFYNGSGATLIKEAEELLLIAKSEF